MDDTSQHRPSLVAAALVACAAAAAYVPSLGNGFVDWDDLDAIVLNPLLERDLPGLLSGAFGTLHGAFYIPLTWVSFWIDRQAWGTEPFGNHLSNLLLHAWAAACVTLLAARIERILDPAAPRWRTALLAALAGGLWALHPLRVESVAWATERKDVLSAALGLPALLAYLRFATRPTPRRATDPLLLGSFALAGLAMLAKPTFMVLPVALLVLDAWPLGRARRGERWAALVVEKVPLLLTGAAIAVVTVIAQRPALAPLGDVPPVSRVLVALRAIVEYLGMIAWPSGLMPYYLHPGATARPSDLTYLWPAAVVLAASAAAVILRRRAPWLLAAWLLFLIPLFPVLGLAQAGGQRLADRFTYVASLAPTLLVVLGGARLARSAGLRLLSPAAGVAALAALAALVVATERLIPIWHDSGALWTRVIDLMPGEMGKAYYFRARHLLAAGDPAGALADASRSLAIARDKGYRRAFEVRGLRAQALAALGRLAEAEQEYRGAIAEAPPDEAGRYDSALREVIARAAGGERSR